MFSVLSGCEEICFLVLFGLFFFLEQVKLRRDLLFLDYSSGQLMFGPHSVFAVSGG